METPEARAAQGRFTPFGSLLERVRKMVSGGRWYRAEDGIGRKTVSGEAVRPAQQVGQGVARPRTPAVPRLTQASDVAGTRCV